MYAIGEHVVLATYPEEQRQLRHETDLPAQLVNVVVDAPRQLGSHFDRLSAFRLHRVLVGGAELANGHAASHDGEAEASATGTQRRRRAWATRRRRRARPGGLCSTASDRRRRFHESCSCDQW